MKSKWWWMIVGLAGMVGYALQAAAQGGLQFTAAQVNGGKAAYEQGCARCHGTNLSNGEMGPPLLGAVFIGHWAGRAVADLFNYTRQTMPQDAPDSLSVDRYAELIAYILSQNGLGREAGVALPSDPMALSALRLPGRPSEANGAGGAAGTAALGVRLPPWPRGSDPLAALTPVTEGMLRDPAAGDWLTWRRDEAGTNFSPLSQITRADAAELRLAWALALPAGPNEMTPLAHDGVLFMQSTDPQADHVLALDGATGRILWHYVRPLPGHTRGGIARALAIYGDKLYLGTSDDHVVALYAKTGKVAWDVVIADPKQFRVDGGPLAVQGKIMQGVAGSGAGGGYIVGLDADSGSEAWRVHTIAQPGDPNDSSWNGAPLAERNGGSVWTPGVYDPDAKLAYFGVGNTYDTAPLVHRKPGFGNDGLYLDSTLAIDPDSGRVVWYYQHLPNDEWDLDSGIEHLLVRLAVHGKPQTLVLAMGKPAIGDLLQAADGRYVSSFDLGLQNFIKAIDPQTGRKSIDPRFYPGNSATVTLCPSTSGGKNWLPGSYNARTGLLYEPLNESCMDMSPAPAGSRGSFANGETFTFRPPPGSDGLYGRLEAIALPTGKPVWSVRQRAAQTSGVLDTAGGVLFAGALDRSFAAYDDATGRQLWKTYLTDMPSSTPVSYTANGKQYVAITVGYGSSQRGRFPSILPDVTLPPANSAAIWVFELPARR